MAAQGPIDVEMPGCPTGPTGEMWPAKNMPWREMPNPWPLDPAVPNSGGRIAPPAGRDMDDVNNPSDPI